MRMTIVGIIMLAIVLVSCDTHTHYIRIPTKPDTVVVIDTVKVCRHHH
jgi:hypothetical protein